MNDFCQGIDNQMNKKSLISPSGQWSIVNSFYINAIISKKSSIFASCKRCLKQRHLMKRLLSYIDKR